MSLEIERKFLVLSDAFKKESHKKYKIKQGFLNSHKERTVRVRITETKGYLTVKGVSNNNGISRFEWEKEITILEAEQLLSLCEESIIDKTRYLIKSNNHLFEVDEFYGENTGLTVAEIELETENETFKKPNWLDKEVTGDIRYYNSQLSKNPYKKWKK